MLPSLLCGTLQASCSHTQYLRSSLWVSFHLPGASWLHLALVFSALGLAILQEGSIYDYLFDKAQCGWRHWMDTVPVQEVPTSAAFHEIIVQTIDTVRYTYLLNMLVSHGYHTLFTGWVPCITPSTQRSGCLPVCMPVVMWSCGPGVLLRPFCKYSLHPLTA